MTRDQGNYSHPMKIVVTGGSGLLGSEVVRTLAAAGATVTSASRRTGVDLATGAGLQAALNGADCVVHAATHRLRSRGVELDGARRMIKILANRPMPPHIVYISIVGCDRIPLRYYRVKYACELALERSQLPVTVLRATQFHTLIREIARAVTFGPLSFAPRGMSFQPCDHRWVAGELADIALKPASSGYQHAADHAGPERVSFSEAVQLIRAKNGKPPTRMITLPPIGGVLQAFKGGADLPDADATIGGSSFHEFLTP
jgi:uncharacterized protein YbjT (DUF2867 family)